MSFFKSLTSAALSLTVFPSSVQAGVSDEYTPFDTLYSRGIWRLDLNQVARGNTLYLRNGRGNDIARFSLSGSSATLNSIAPVSAVLSVVFAVTTRLTKPA